MLDFLIRFSLQQRVLIIAVAACLCGAGTWQVLRMPIDVFPDLNRPRVVIMTEAPGMAPEEVESLITFPIETSVNGANGVEAVRSSSGVGISVVYVEFAYGTDIFIDRQVVAERLQTLQDRLPSGITPQLAPISSIMGQVLMLGMWSEEKEADVMELRTTADWVVRQRLLTIPGVSQVFTMGGSRKQYQVLVDPESMNRYGVTIVQIEEAVRASNENGTGGYLDRQGPNELLVRSLGRLSSIEDLKKIPVAIYDGTPVMLSQVADVQQMGQVKRGDSSAFVRNEGKYEQDASSNSWSGGPAVVFTINKQPGADTRKVTESIYHAVEEMRLTLPKGYRIEPLYEQRSFIDRAIENVMEALRDGAILVVIVLFLFLMNLRITFITLTAIPLSLLTTAIVFSFFGLSINTMTLGGVAVAMGELVDDAIVDVENIFRRLKENRAKANPDPTIQVVYEASAEVRKSIVFGTIIVILVFCPLFALGGMEGKIFAPLGLAYIVSILASLVVSLTVTPVLSFWLLGKVASSHVEKDGLVLRLVKGVGEKVIRFSLRFPVLNLALTLALVLLAAWKLVQFDRDFLPPFNEGTIQLNVVLPPGTSLTAANEVCTSVENRLKEVKEIKKFARRTGRAELDEHAEGVNMTEFLIELDPESHRSREDQIDELRHAMTEIPGIATAVEQPIAHLISHMLSGVKAQVGIKIYGDDLDVLRKTAEAMQTKVASVPGVTDLLIEPQVIIPQLRIELNRDKLLQHGLSAREVNEIVQTAMNGTIVSEVMEGQRNFDLVVRMKEDFREDIEAIKRLAIQLPGGGVVPLQSLADIYESGGPNTVNREKVRRRIVLQCNVEGRGVVDVVQDIKQSIGPTIQSMPSNYHVEFGGQFESQESASRAITVLFAATLVGVFLVLYVLFQSSNLSLQVMAALPMAFIGSVAALTITGQTLTIAAMVGFISLAGIASRNGILLLQHYLHLVEFEGEQVDAKMILRAGLERLAPVLMTALTSGIALIPLVLAAGEPGKEVLYPVATVILGGLLSSTALDFFVHPALFWLFGRKSAARVIQKRKALQEGIVS